MGRLLFLKFYICFFQFFLCSTNELQKIMKQLSDNKNTNSYGIVWEFLDFHFRKLESVALLQSSSSFPQNEIFRREFYLFLNKNFQKPISILDFNFSTVVNKQDLKPLREIGYIIYLTNNKSLVDIFLMMESLKIEWDFDSQFFVICDAECKRKNLFVDLYPKQRISLLNVLPMTIVVDINENIVCIICPPSNKTLDISIKVFM